MIAPGFHVPRKDLGKFIFFGGLVSLIGGLLVGVPVIILSLQQYKSASTSKLTQKEWKWLRAGLVLGILGTLRDLIWFGYHAVLKIKGLS